jgi:hypothetical protein
MVRRGSRYRRPGTTAPRRRRHGGPTIRARHQLVVERTDQQQVVGLGAPAPAPPHQVVGLRERSGAASGEPAAAISIADLAQHPGWRPPRAAAQRDHTIRRVGHHGLHPRAAQQAFDGAEGHGSAFLGLTSVDARLVGFVSVAKRRKRCVDDDHRSIGHVALGEGARAQRHQRVGPSSLDEAAVLLTGHHGDLFGQACDGSDHDRTLCGRELGLESEASPLVGPPPRERSRALRVPDVLVGRPGRHVAAPSHGGTGHFSGPPHQVRLGLRGREPSDLEDLVDPERSARQGVGESRQPLERVGRADPSVRLPGGDVVAHREPVRGITCAVVSPRLRAVQLRHELQQRSMGFTRAPVGLVECMKQMDDPSGGLVEGVDRDRCEHVFEPRSMARARL